MLGGIIERAMCSRVRVLLGWQGWWGPVGWPPRLWAGERAWTVKWNKKKSFRNKTVPQSTAPQWRGPPHLWRSQTCNVKSWCVLGLAWMMPLNTLSKIPQATADPRAQLGLTKNTRFGLIPSSNPVGGILEDSDDERGKGEVIRSRVCGGRGYSNIVAFGFEE